MRKITSLLMLLCVFVGTAWGQEPIAGIKTIPTSAIDFSTSSLATGYYLIKQTNSAETTGFLKAASESEGAVVTPNSTGPVANSINDATYIWYVEVNEDKFSVATANKVAAWQAPTQGQKNLVAYASKATTLELESDFDGLTGNTQTLVKAFWENQNCYSYVHASSHNLGSWNDQNKASLFYLEFYPIDVDELIYAANKDALKAKIEELSMSVGRLTLQTANSEGAFYLSAVTDADGNTVNKLIDGDPSTFYGSSWQAALGHLHYWQIDLVDATLPEFAFGYITRANGSDTPTKIDIKGSMDGEEFTSIVSLTDLPTDGGASYKSATISNSEEYRYIRFEVPTTKNNYHPGGQDSEVTIALAEFALFITEANYSDVDKYILSLVKEAQEVVDDENASQAEVDAALVALSNALESTVRYSFQYEGVEKYTQETKAAYGQVYPAYTVQLPYGISAEPQTTTIQLEDCGKVVEKVVELKKVKDIPFVSYASAAEIKKWYYMRMHTNQPGYIGDIADEDKTINVAYGKKATADKLENFMWGFVGDVFGGITVVNKGTGLQLNSTGDGNATLAETGTSLFIAATTETSANAKYGFCLRKKDSKKYLNANYGDGKLSHWESTDAGSTFFLTEVDKATEVKVSNAGYATLFLDYATYIPEEVEAYIVASIDNTSATLAQVTGTLPEKTGVIVKAAEGVYNFTVSAEAAASVSGNLLRGSVEDAYIEGEAYVLANAKNGVGLYKAELNKNANGEAGTTHFLNNANKAYLPKPAEASARFISFDFGTETAIENIEGAEVESAVVYDLSGRRVQKAQKGVFIVNGKVVIK